jgi:S-DNA-T family DNA segregation ATPase FtsK/SpoIIIE
MGGEKLLGKGDMVFQRPGFPILERIQGAFVSDEEVIKLVAEVKANDTSNYDATMIQWIEEEARRATVDDSDLFTDSDSDLDPKWDESITIAQTHGVVSASFLQRHLKIGYNRAARIVDQMEKQSLVAKADGSKPRKWLGQQII